MIILGTRILHCGKSIENYHLCIRKKIFGFTRRIANVGDTVYLVVKINKDSFCGARGVISEITDVRPWKESDLYPQAYNVENIEFCEPFDIRILSEVGGKYWSLKYSQGSKTIDLNATHLLNEKFMERKTDHNHYFNLQENIELINGQEIEDRIEISDLDYNDIIQEVPDEKYNIMGTFLTIKFYNETDPIKGLESLVNQNFYNLFEDFPESKTILISENRMFVSTKAINSNKEHVNGTSGIPDAILIKFNKTDKCPIQINLIEYECYGETKTKAMDKFEYINGHIIPQLMRFASTFSIVTDNKIREETIKKWTDKIIDFIFNNSEINNKFTNWIRELNPEISERRISLEMHNMIIAAFQTNLRILLIIDELSIEQKETIKNIINSFKLDSGKGIEFLGFVVRLEQKINLINTNFEYALAIQK